MSLISRSTSARRAIQQIEKFAPLSEPVVLLGETGSGKGFFARHLHDISGRSGRTFRAVTLAGLDDTLASSALWGHVPGAFTDARGRREGEFALAHGGTLFLDEVGKSSLAVQSKLLTVLESHEFAPLGSDRKIHVDVRLIFAANESLDVLVERGRMLEDFVPRLGWFRVTIPPLRDRREDIPELVSQLILTHAPRFGYPAGIVPTVHPLLMQALVSAEWRYNIRELEGVTKRLLVEARGAPQLTTRLCSGDLAHLAKAASKRRPRGARAVELRAAIEQCGGKSAAANAVGVSRSTAWRHLNAFNDREVPELPRAQYTGNSRKEAAEADR